MEKRMVITYTGENYQPCRIFYKCSDKELLHRKLKRLRCMDYAEDYDLWQWLFTDEAKRIDLNKSFNDIPRHLRPIVLGSFYIREDEVIFDAHSYDRAIAALNFFTKHISNDILSPDEIAFVNKIFSFEDVDPSEAEIANHDKYFANTYSTENAVEKALSKTEELESLEMLTTIVDKARKQPIEWVERLHIHFEEEGTDGITSTLLMRSAVARKRWDGDKDYSLLDLVKDTFSDPEFIKKLDLDDKLLEAVNTNNEKD